MNPLTLHGEKGTSIPMDEYQLSFAESIVEKGMVICILTIIRK
jgi:hypothetical protein